MSNPSITPDAAQWWQWDTGRTVTVAGGTMTECHFANRKQGSAYVQAVINGVARVPDELLQVAAPITAYGYVEDEAGAQTRVEVAFDVKARNIPSGYTYTKTAQKTIRDAEVARDEAVQAAKDAKASALAADDSAIKASKSAQSAGESASAAATSASNAAKSAGEAAKSASDAKAAAGKVVEDASELLKTYTDDAKTSADNAATSASNAADAASAASRSAGEAKQSATDASNAKVAAQTAKAKAETAKGEAATSASNAAESATAAAKSASNAAASVDAINIISPKTTTTSASANGSSIAFGDSAQCASNKNWAIAIGVNANVKSGGSIAIGSNAHESNEVNSANVAIGDNATIENCEYSIALGAYSKATHTSECSIGSPAHADGSEITREITHVSEPGAPTSASTKKYTDDNDAKTLSEAKKYTDDNTTNALIGKVSGKLLHVEDAWPSPLLSVTIDGAYKQDGTPSPESPAPIEVVENPVLNVMGRNLVDVSDKIVEAKGAGVTIPCGLIPSGTEAFLSFVASNNSAPTNTGGTAWSLFGKNSAEVKHNIQPINITKGINKSSMTTTFDVVKHLTIYGYRYPETAFEMSDYQLEVGGYHDYRPYTSQSLPITLPDEHPYLAALPDGTRDEIIINSAGDVTLIARVGKVLVADQTILVYNTNTTPYALFNLIVPTGVANALMCNTHKPVQCSDVSGTVYSPNGHDIVIRDSRFTSLDVAKELLADTVLYYHMITHVTYSLGKLDIHSLPETISNVWTSAELTTDMSMTYKRDVNVVIAGLTAQINALKGTADESTLPDQTIE